MLQFYNNCQYFIILLDYCKVVGGFQMTNELLLFSSELENSLNPKTPEDIVSVQRGLLLYTQNMVYGKKETNEIISATVQDVVPCQVTLDLTFPKNSSCSCKRQTICRHQLAVFFSSYSSIGSVSDWIRDWKHSSHSSNNHVIQLQKAKELLQSEPKIEHTYDGWKHYLEEMFKKQIIYSLQQPSYTFAQKWDQYLHRVKAKMPIEAEWRLLYLFITYFHTFQMTLRCLNDSEISHNTRHYLEKEVHELVDNILHIMEQLTSISRPFSFDEYYLGIRHDMKFLLEECGSFSDAALNIYRSIWSNLLKEKAWRKEEFAEVYDHLQTLPPSTEKATVSDSYLIATIHLALLIGHEDQVNKLLPEMHPKDIPLISYWIRYEDEKKVAPFIEFIIKDGLKFFDYASNYYRRKEFVQYFLPHVKKYCINNRKLDTFEKYCEAYLPYSFVYFSNYLLDASKYKKWVELYLYSKIELDYISADEIKIVQQHDPSLLLPLFTSIVNEKIENKNRQSYRAAIRYLKKIRTIYKKMKKLDQWERYIDKIQTSHKRLRAFQEELKRGKLIDVE